MTASAVSVRLGTELPQIIHVPPDVVSRDAGEDTIALANSYMFDAPACLSPSQELRLRNGMATRADGKWAASRVGDFGGRQGAGKTDTILARILAGVLLLDEQLIIYTAHEFPTANEIFLRLLGLFDNWDDLGRELAKPPKRAHGDQGFELVGGRRILIKTRTGRSGRGFAKADLLVYDEAQHLQPEHVAGSGPAKLAHPNPQSWYAGSGGLATSVKAWEMRRQAITGTGGRLSYTEHTAQTVTVSGDKIVMFDPDPEDRDAWARANPGLGRWVTEEGMEDMRAELGDLFPREGLCVWEPEVGTEQGPIPIDRWNDLTDGASLPNDSTVRLALDAPPDRKSATFASAGLRGDNLLHVQVRYHEPLAKEATPLKDRVVALALALTKGHNTPLILPPSSPARAWKADLVAAGVPLDEMTPAEYAEACGRIANAVDEGALRHRGQPELTNAVAGLASKASGDVEAWSRRNSSSNIAPFVAATCALARVPQVVQQAPQIWSWSAVLGARSEET